MPQDFQNAINDRRVAVAELGEAAYPAPEAAGENEVAKAVRRAAENLGWSGENRGAFGRVIKRGARVVVKPNFVLHANQRPGGGLDALVTHPSVVRAVVEEVLKADPAQVVVGDAPVQSCDWAGLMRATGLDEWARQLRERDARFLGLHDYRRTICMYRDGVRQAEENRQPEENFVLYNLGEDSLLEPLTGDDAAFRVTCYDPRLMAKTHSRGNHQYLVAREIIEADVVINLPKLKTHRKAGITSALKNLVGINGNKEYLPHHRVGGAGSGGDCYPESDMVKRVWEFVADRRNMTASPAKGKFLATIGTQLERVMRLRGDEIGVEGAWSGNETVPRMCLDLNRILLYGKPDAGLGGTPQRRVLHVVDAVVAGQGEGPLAPEPLALGLILAGENAAAADWVGACLLGYEPSRIPLLRHSFEPFRWPLTAFAPEEIVICGGATCGGGEISTLDDLRAAARNREVKHPAGWRDAADKARTRE